MIEGRQAAITWGADKVGRRYTGSDEREHSWNTLTFINRRRREETD